MKFEELNSELRNKIAGKSPEELRALAEEEGHELSDEELESIAGGGWSGSYSCECRYCGATVNPDADWCPECDAWLGEGNPPLIAPAKEDR